MTRLVTNPTILLVEDDTDDVFIFQEVLRGLNLKCDFHHAINGLEAIKKLNLMKPEKPNFIFTDLNMPIMDGWQFLQEIKQVRSFKDIPVFVLTTAMDKDSMTKSIAAGATNYFTKPQKEEELKSIIQSVADLFY